MEIFNKSLFGDDAIEFCKLPKEQKENWIRKYTNQQNDEIIEEFLNNPLKDGDCGCGCGGKKSTDGNISKDVPTETNTDVVNNEASGDGGGGANKRRKNNKTS